MDFCALDHMSLEDVFAVKWNSTSFTNKWPKHKERA